MDKANPAELRARANRYRRLRRGTGDPQAIEALNTLANECEANADAAEKAVSRHQMSSQAKSSDLRGE